MDHVTSRREWRDRIAAYRESGLSMRAWCKETGHTRDRLRYWLAKYPASENVCSARSAGWVSVNLEPTTPVEHSRTSITVRVTGVEIEVVRGFDPELLRSVVQALGGRV
jgi:hypothetical protein